MQFSLKVDAPDWQRDHSGHVNPKIACQACGQWILRAEQGYCLWDLYQSLERPVSVTVVHTDCVAAFRRKRKQSEQRFTQAAPLSWFLLALVQRLRVADARDIIDNAYQPLWPPRTSLARRLAEAGQRDVADTAVDR